MLSESARDRAISFGPFCLLVSQRLLLDGGRPVRIGSRALDLLVALATRPSELVSKRELMEAGWPETTVVETNLAVNINAVRRALGDGQDGRRYIVNVPGRGYRFVGPVALADQLNSMSPPPETTDRPHNLPAQLTRLIGRSEVVASIVKQLATERLITIVGAAGIGKTAVALDVAEERIQSYEHGVWLIELAPISDPRLVPNALAAALRQEVRSDDPLPALIAAVSDKRILLVFDNCEHVIEAVAALVTRIMKDSRSIRILATSREPLRVVGERVRRLPPLESPPASIPLSAEEALTFPAVQLFVQRAAATGEFELSDADASGVGDICRQLDGIPLAIEFAAARVDAFGVRGLAARLSDRLRLLTGRRTALPHHRTIAAALDWSYRLLTEEQQSAFRRLAIFAGGFTLEAAAAVAAHAGPAEGDIADDLGELVAKSLVVADVLGTEPRFRLLETMRAYTWAKLIEDGERDMLGRRHAEYYRDLLETTARDQMAASNWPGPFAAEIDNIRAALGWAFSPAGDLSLGVGLAAASAPVWLGMSMLTECRDWMEKAVAGLDAGGRGTRQELVIRAALATAVFFTQGMSDEAYAMWVKQRELAESLHDTECEMSALIPLWAYQIRRPFYQEALGLAMQCEAVAKQVADPGHLVMADWMLGVTKHHSGDLVGARPHLQRSVDEDTDAARRAFAARYSYDRHSDSLSVLASLLWLQGFPTQASRTSVAAVEQARAMGYDLPLCQALLWRGFNTYVTDVDLAATERLAAELIERAEKHTLGSHRAMGLCLMGVCRIHCDDLATGLRRLSDGLDGLATSRYEVFRPLFVGELAKAMVATGHVNEGLAAITELERLERNPEHWCLPELLRSKGQLLLMQSDKNAAAAVKQFKLSLAIARKQGALSWELRTAVSLAGLQLEQGRPREAHELLASTYGRFSEGFETADLKAAKLLLNELENWRPKRPSIKRSLF